MLSRTEISMWNAEAQSLLLPSMRANGRDFLWQYAAQEGTHKDMDLGFPNKWPDRSYPIGKFKVDKPHPHAQSFQSAFSFSLPFLKYKQANSTKELPDI